MATQGPNSGGTFTNVDFGGGVAWTNPSNAASSNNSYATSDLASGFNTDFLIATNLGFSIPDGSTIDGLLVEIERKASSGTEDGSDGAACTFTKDGTSQAGDSLVSEPSFMTTTDAVLSLGGATELWGMTWTPAEINASTFGFRYTALWWTAVTTISVDHIRVTVYYTPAAGGGIPRGAFSKPFRGPFGGSIGW